MGRKPNQRHSGSNKLKYPTVKVIGFPKGAGHQYIDYVNKTSVDAVAIDTSVDPSWAAKELDEKVVDSGEYGSYRSDSWRGAYVKSSQFYYRQYERAPTYFQSRSRRLQKHRQKMSKFLQISSEISGKVNPQMEHYNLIKALHLISVIALMAGLLYLPRLYVYHADNIGQPVLNRTFKIMERRLMLYIMNPAMIASFVLVYG